LVNRIPKRLLIVLAACGLALVPYIRTTYQAGYTRWIARAWDLQTGLGASAGLVAVPQSLESAYGRRVAGEFAVFLHVRVK